MVKYSNEQKLEVIMGIIEKGMSRQAAANIIGANKTDARKWLLLYEEHGVEGLLMKKGKITYNKQRYCPEDNTFLVADF